MSFSTTYQKMRDAVVGRFRRPEAESVCDDGVSSEALSAVTPVEKQPPARGVQNTSSLTEDRVASDWRLSSVADIPFDVLPCEASPLRSYSTAESTLTFDSSNSSVRAGSFVGAADESVRWFVDVGALWDMDDGEFQFLANTVRDPAERASIHKYRTRPDRLRALASRLLARRACSVVCNLEDEEVAIARTTGGKPFLCSPNTQTLRQPNFNFSISHDDDYVCIVTDPVCLVGVDLVAPYCAAAAKCNSLSSFEHSFTASEWVAITSQPTAEQRWFYFAIFWSCKEAFVKARGDGLAFDLKAADFSVIAADEGMARVQLGLSINGVAMHRWSFHSSLLPGGYRVTVAKGPPGDAVDAIGKSFRRSADSFSSKEWAALVSNPASEFVDVSVGHLVPEAARSEYQDVYGGEVPDEPFSFSPASRVASADSLATDV
eukprot:TRINITY_DN1664_c0_g1_i1.p1 TRINITY_DN1664_c0_g1~~TRINITY_DN1664_c0_g1_i1.p1  ORF type:complete len:467 (+),score=138.61 TRINITY_DN1664_c0_g1_i1:105-1403(+)